MKINGNDVYRFGATQLTVDFKAPEEGIETEWQDGAPLPRELSYYPKLGGVTVTLLMRGSCRDEIVRNTSQLIGTLTTSVELQLDGYHGFFKGFYSGSDLKKVSRRKDKYILTLNFKGYRHDSRVSLDFSGTDRAALTAAGTRYTPAVVTVKALATLDSFTLSGFPGGDITVSGMAASEVVTIDGERGTATSGGENIFHRVELWAFPQLKPGMNLLAFSDSRCEVTVSYLPMWL